MYDTADRPEEFRYDLGYGTVRAVYPASWEVDIVAEEGGLVQRALVLTSRLPEPSTPERPQWVVFGFASHLQGRPLCWPIPSRLTGSRLPRKDLVWYDEVGPYRLSINTANEFEVRNADGEALHRIRIQLYAGCKAVIVKTRGMAGNVRERVLCQLPRFCGLSAAGWAYSWAW